jgi:hypothetical protein
VKDTREAFVDQSSAYYYSIGIFGGRKSDKQSGEELDSLNVRLRDRAGLDKSQGVFR